MNDTMRYVVFVVLMMLILLLQPIYLEWLGYDQNNNNKNQSKKDSLKNDFYTDNLTSNKKNNDLLKVNNILEEAIITVSTPLYLATISNRSGGSVVNFVLSEIDGEQYKYSGGYTNVGHYNSEIPVSLALNDKNYCQPCLAYYNDSKDQYSFINQIFYLDDKYQNGDTIIINNDESLKLNYVLKNDAGNVLIKKNIVFNANNYISEHAYFVNDKFFSYSNALELVWSGGLRPSEEISNEDVQYGSAIISQGGETESVQMTGPDQALYRNIFSGKTEWVAIRTKYFLSALIPKESGSFATLGYSNKSFGELEHVPAYSASIGFSLDTSYISSQLYLGPLDIDNIAETNSSLDETMNWGWAIIQPISKGILWVLKYIHNTFHLNYGYVLLLFALLIRFITGPLTKKSFQSTQKMQKIQPEIKKIQEKYKKEPQRLNKETMGLYKKHGVNPLGGCLPMLLQMPLLMALFVVFRSTIEFRGEPFVLWINDLSKPDIVLNLPFNVPIYGSGVAILPLIMGATLFMTMKMSSSTMDKSQKPVMYIMNGFFILLFNSFPAGLNLYYTAYNVLSFLQQRKIKAQHSI